MPTYEVVYSIAGRATDSVTLQAQNEREATKAGMRLARKTNKRWASTIQLASVRRIEDGYEQTQ